MSQNLTNFDAMLKEFYPKDVILDLVKQRAPFYFEFQKSKRVSADGRRVIQPVHSARNTGVSALGEGGVDVFQDHVGALVCFWPDDPQIDPRLFQRRRQCLGAE